MLQDDGTVNWHEAIKRLTEWVRPRLQEPADADELVQDILERLVTHEAQLQIVGNPLGWIHRIAANAIIDYYRPHRSLILETNTKIWKFSFQRVNELKITPCLRRRLELW